MLSNDEKEQAVLSLLDNPRVIYDEDHALILMQMHGLKQGMRYLYQKGHMYHMLLQQYMEDGDDEAVLELVRQQFTTDSNLWLLALKYFSEKSLKAPQKNKYNNSSNNHSRKASSSSSRRNVNGKSASSICRSICVRTSVYKYMHARRNE
jgi:hypothetical protein